MNRKSTPPNPIPNPNPDPSRAMLALNFLQALNRINQTVPKMAHSHRARRIRRAAYTYMAYTAGPTRRWSQALLRRLHQPVNRPSRFLVVRRRVRVAVQRSGEPTSSETLRRLVPGGRNMDYCNLLEETADYVRCLRAQVQLMQSLVNSSSC